MKLFNTLALLGLSWAYTNDVIIKTTRMNEVVASLKSESLETVTVVETTIDKTVEIDKTSHTYITSSTRSSVGFLPAHGPCSLHWSLCPNMCNVEYELKYRFVAIRGQKMEEYENFMDTMAVRKDAIIKDLDGKATEIFELEVKRNKTSLDLEGLEDAFILELSNDIKQARIINQGLLALKFSVIEIKGVLTTLSADIKGAYANCQNQAPCMAVPVCKLGSASGESCTDIVDKSIDTVDGDSVNHQKSGIYLIAPHGLPPKHTLCRNDMLGGAYTVIQNRYNGTVDFNRGWLDYANGFGDVAHLNSPDCEIGEFWLGNEYINGIQLRRNALMVDMKRANGQRGVVKYDNFKIGDRSSSYQLQAVEGFADDVCKIKVGDSFSGASFGSQGYGSVDKANTDHHGMKFSTYDRDNDMDKNRNCADEDQSGWWFNRCSAVNLNGVYHDGKYDKADTNTGEFDDGILWNTWTQDKYEALTATQMAVGVDKGFNNRICDGEGDATVDYHETDEYESSYEEYYYK